MCVKNANFHKVCVAQLVEYWIIVPKEGGSSAPGVFAAASIQSSVNLRQLSRTQRRAECRTALPGTARDVTARHGMAASTPPPRVFTSWLA
jgi:hypothetical protein